jgi:hypothetical protein
MFFYPLRNSIDAGGTMQIRPRLGNSRLCVIRIFRFTKQKSRVSRAALGVALGVVLGVVWRSERCFRIT